jgi:formate dehydrogenase subunit gamma
VRRRPRAARRGVRAAAPRFAPPASFAAAPSRKAEDSNAQRAKSQPGNNAPFWRGVHDSGTQPGITSLPGAEKGVLIQPFVQYPGSRWTNAGEAWRQVRNQWIIPYGGSLIFIVALALALYYIAKGPARPQREPRPSGHRTLHLLRARRPLSNAIAFWRARDLGHRDGFGKFFLLPIIGGTLFGGLAYVLKTAHNFFGTLFAVSLVIVFVTFVRDNFPCAACDLNWLLKGGGAFGNRNEPPSGPLQNAARCSCSGAACSVLGLVLVGSGLVLDKVVPGLDYLRGDMQVTHMVHSVAAVLMISLFLLHIYLGTIGVRGAYRAMRDGEVDEAWAREHHAYWYRDIQEGRIPARRTRPSSDEVPPVRPATP